MPRRAPRDVQVAEVLAWLDRVADLPARALTLPPPSLEEQRLAQLLAKLPRTGEPLDLPGSDAVGMLP